MNIIKYVLRIISDQRIKHLVDQKAVRGDYFSTWKSSTFGGHRKLKINTLDPGKRDDSIDEGRGGWKINPAPQANLKL